jgi:hypothetical protein
MSDRPPIEIAPAMLREQLLKSCAFHFEDSLSGDDSDGDRRRIRDGLRAAKAAIESVDTVGALGSYVHRLMVALEHERAQFLAFDTDDPDRWRAGAVRTILRELEHTAGWLLPTSRSQIGEKMLVSQDLLVLIERQMPLLRELHRLGSLAPVAATMDEGGEVTGEAFTNDEAANVPVENTLDRFARQFARAFADGEPIKAAAIFFHGHTADASVHAAHTIDEANAIVAWLQHQTGQSVQAVIRYKLERVAGSDVTEWMYGEPIFSEVPAFPIE